MTATAPTLAEIIDHHYREQLEAAKKIDPGVAEWIDQELAAGLSPEYVHDTLKSAVAEARRQKAGGQ